MKLPRKVTLYAVAGVAVALGVLTAVMASPVEAVSGHGPQQRNSATGGGATSAGVFKNVPNPICSTPTSSAANVNIDCENLAPNDETPIAVNPLNSQNLLGSGNDTQYQYTGSGGEKIYGFIRAHWSLDGGKTWTTSPIDLSGYNNSSDPSVSFDADGRAYLSVVAYVYSQGAGGGVAPINPDLLVASSADGGKTWTKPVVVAKGQGSSKNNGLFNDKPYQTSWGHGNVAVTWTQFNSGPGGALINAPIAAAVSHDGGATWASPQIISGSSPACAGVTSANACDLDQFSYPVMTTNGNLLASFVSTRDLSNGRGVQMVVKLDPQSGAALGNPAKVMDLYDGATDFPINDFGETTLQDSAFRTSGAGNIAADPRNGNHLAIIDADMRNTAQPVASDAYSAKTNQDIVLSQSFDGGLTWSTPTALALPGDQFMPWGAYDPSGRLRIGAFDRQYDPANHKYGYTLFTEKSAGSLTFNSKQMSTALSDPTTGSRWYTDPANTPGFPNANSFLGDYSGIAVTPQGRVVALWTDMRGQTCVQGVCGSQEDAFFGSSN